MVFGVDECRMCGRPMPVSGPEVLQRHLAFTRRKIVTIPEKEWRALGFKAMPTPQQLAHPQEGCCFQCKLDMGVDRSAPRRLIAFTIPIAIVTVFFLFYVAWRLV